MAYKTMYPAINNSPVTTLTVAITASDTSIAVDDVSAFPTAPNIVTIGTDENAELVLYTGISGSKLTGCTRGFNGTKATTWAAETKIYRAFTAYDHDTFKANIEELQKTAATADELSQLKVELKNVSAHQNVLIGNESGNPISTSDAFAAPLCGLHIYGRSRQDGTPSADNPVEIGGAGADGTLQVKITGANLLDFEKAASENANAEFTFENGILTVKALNKQGWAGIFIPLPDECAGKQIFFRSTIDSNPNGLKSLIQMRYSLNGKTVYFSSTSILKIPEGASDIRYNVMARNENTAAEGTITVQYPVVCYGSALLPYEPYHEQVITVQTSGGLHGIPVSSGGNFVDENGQRWVCDEIDFTQGKRIKRVNVEALDATKTLSEQSGFEMEPVEFPLSSEEIAAYGALMAYAQTTVVQAKNVAGIRLDYQRDVNRVIQNLENAIASMTTA